MNEFSPKILIVEDDMRISNFLAYILENEGYNYLTASSAQRALSYLVSEQVDIVLLDLGLPDFDGLSVISKVREWSDVPIIVVSARDQDKEKAEALDLGADDYISKPFSATELLARTRVALRHIHRSQQSQNRSVLEIKNLRCNLEKHKVYKDNEEIHLTPMEYNLLILFMNNIEKVLTTTHIIHVIWGSGYGDDTQVLRTLMASLRRKIEKNPAKPEYIKTEIGIGYRLSDE